MNFRQSVSRFAVGVACIAAPAAHAEIFTVTGTTAGKPTFNRPLEELTGLSPVGTSVRYDLLPFTVSIAGDYTFATTGLFDTFAILYQGPFNPRSPLANAVEANDDLDDGFNFSGFGYELVAGTAYNYVTTGFDLADFGAFSTTIGGPGVITVVPEPETYALFGLGLGMIAVLRRRERSAND